MASGHALGVGLYSKVEAARLLHTPLRTLARWVEGYVRELRGGPKTYAPMIDRENECVLSFGDLVELLYARDFRNAGEVGQNGWIVISRYHNQRRRGRWRS